MKRFLISFLLFLIIPTMSWGYNDSCSFPDKYTVDKRCYVTEEQKNQNPYNTVVAIVGEELCSGVVAKAKDDELYVYTAKHCVSDKNGITKGAIDIKTQDGKVVTVDIVQVGKYRPNRAKGNAYYAMPETYSGIGNTLVLLDGTKPDCTGNVTEGNGITLFSVNKDCVDEFNVAKAVINVKDVDGTVLELEKIEEIPSSDQVREDFAVYIVPEKYYNDIAQTGISTVVGGELSFGPNKLVGYSLLKVMSDAEIEDFKQKYINYLMEKHGIESKGNEFGLGFYRGGINFNNSYSRNYLYYLDDNNKSYYQETFNDVNRLKTLSFDGLSSDKFACSGYRSTQSWSASSSAGIFDKYGNLYALHNQERTTMGVTDGGTGNECVVIRDVHSPDSSLF